ncbi:hypothetical protein [Aquifex aeolicus]|uniref:hypothetical protein n=1 Tax=Aquifex aeolicus TaxID=63363 RepID=UPI0002DC571E|nr:hypothetical protein [Aquifex aeolicus]
MELWETIKKILILIGAEIYAFIIAIIVGFPLLIVIILISNWIYKKFAKRFEEAIKKKYQQGD